MINRFSSFTITLVIVLVAVILVSCTQKAPEGKKEVYVAIVSSLTGELAENGKDTANGAIMAIDEYNKSANGKKVIRYELLDDKGEPKTAVNIASQICQDKKYDLVIGHLTSGAMSATAPIYNKCQIPVIMPVPTNPQITKQGFNNLFRIPPTDDDQAPFLAKYIYSQNNNAKVAIVNDSTSYGSGFAEAFRDEYAGLGGHIVLFDNEQEDARDYRTLIAKIKSLKPDYVIIGATYDFGAPFVRQMKEMGLNATPVSGDGCYGSAFLKNAGNAAEGAIISFIAPDSGFSDKSINFFKKYERIYGKVVSFAPLGYDAGIVATKAINDATDETRAGLLEVLRNRNFYAEGVTGKIEFQDNGDNKYKNISIYRVTDGMFKLIK